MNTEWIGVVYSPQHPVIIAFPRIACTVARIPGGGRVKQNVFMTRKLIQSVVEMAERTATKLRIEASRRP